MREMLRLTILLTIVTIISAIMLAAVDDLTDGPIAFQKRLEKIRAIKGVLPAYDNEPDQDFVELSTGTNRKGEATKTYFYRAKTEGKITGVAFPVISHEGYSGDIEIMVGITPKGTVTGVEILAHGETPGLGSKIVGYQFKDQLKGKNLDNSRWMVKKDGGDIDQITGATISPRAVIKAVKAGLLFYRLNKEKITDRIIGGEVIEDSAGTSEGILE